MQKYSTYKFAEALCWLGGGFLTGMGTGTLLANHPEEALPYLLIGAIGLWFGRGWVFPKL